MYWKLLGVQQGESEASIIQIVSLQAEMKHILKRNTAKMLGGKFHTLGACQTTFLCSHVRCQKIM